MKFTHLVKALILACILNEVRSQDYCSANICNGRRHVACGHSRVRKRLGFLAEIKFSLKSSSFSFFHHIVQ